MDSEIIAGYKTYIDLLKTDMLAGKEILSTGMMGEIRRCQMAIDRAIKGHKVVIISSGDAGIYGMASLVLELLADQGLSDKLEVRIIPGIPALSAAASLLGAPLTHDFAVISLSDLMTPWELIKSRVKAAAEADFVLVIYNPRSKKRHWQLGRIRDIIKEYREKDCPVGIVRNATRNNESVKITTIAELDGSEVDMLTILIIGNSQTKVCDGKMITPRGYIKKYKNKTTS